MNKLLAVLGVLALILTAIFTVNYFHPFLNFVQLATTVVAGVVTALIITLIFFIVKEVSGE